MRTNLAPLFSYCVEIVLHKRGAWKNKKPQCYMPKNKDQIAKNKKETYVTL